MKRTQRWLAKATRRRRVACVGVTQGYTGRPALVFGRRCRMEDVDHQVSIAEFELVTGHRVEPDAAVGDTFADGVTTIDGRTCYLEVDESGKLTARQYEAKFARYENVTDFILVVCHAEERMQRLRKLGARFPELNILFSTFDRLANVAEPWLDHVGKKLRI